MDTGEIKPLEIPDKYILEMIADWMGAGRAINEDKFTNGWTEKDYWTETSNWWNKTKDSKMIHPKSYDRIESILSGGIIDD